MNVGHMARKLSEMLAGQGAARYGSMGALPLHQVLRPCANQARAGLDDQLAEPPSVSKLEVVLSVINAPCECCSLRSPQNVSLELGNDGSAGVGNDGGAGE